MLGSTNPETQRLAKVAQTLVKASKASNTIKKYSYAFSRWKKWAGKDRTLPATPQDVGLYLTNLAEKQKSLGTLQAALYAISWYHKAAGIDDPTHHPFPAMIIESCKRRFQKPKVQKLHLSVHDMSKLCQKLDGPNRTIRQVRFLTIALLAFAGFLRFSEVSNLTIQDVKFCQTYLTLSINKSKTDQHWMGEQTYIARTGKTTCPVKALETYFTTACLYSNLPHMFIFRKIVRKNNKALLSSDNVKVSYNATRLDFLHLFQGILPDPKKYGLHSFRSGGATTASNNGIGSTLIKKHGRWSTDAANNLYVRQEKNQLLNITKNLGL